MSYGNISAVVSDADKTNFKLKIQEALALLPFLINLSPEERRNLPKMGNNRSNFVRQLIRAADNNPDVLPAYFNLAELKKDVALYAALKDIVIVVQQLLEKMEDTRLAVSSEAYTKALQGKELFAAANRDNPGLDVVVADLEEYFQHTTQDDTPVPPVTPAP